MPAHQPPRGALVLNANRLADRRVILQRHFRNALDRLRERSRARKHARAHIQHRAQRLVARGLDQNFMKRLVGLKAHAAGFNVPLHFNERIVQRAELLVRAPARRQGRDFRFQNQTSLDQIAAEPPVLRNQH